MEETDKLIEKIASKRTDEIRDEVFQACNS